VSFTPLLTVIHVRKITTFCRGVLNILLSKSEDPNTTKLDAEASHYILRTRVVPETEAIDGPGATEARGHTIRLVLELLCIDDAKEITDWATTSIFRWYTEGSEWKSSFEQRLQQLVGDKMFISRRARSESDTLYLDHRLLRTTGLLPSRSYRLCFKHYLTMFESSRWPPFCHH
jgi:hypothetical protein